MLFSHVCMCPALSGYSNQYIIDLTGVMPCNISVPTMIGDTMLSEDRHKVNPHIVTVVGGFEK